MQPPASDDAALDWERLARTALHPTQLSVLLELRSGHASPRHLGRASRASVSSRYSLVEIVCATGGMSMVPSVVRVSVTLRRIAMSGSAAVCSMLAHASRSVLSRSVNTTTRERAPASPGC